MKKIHFFTWVILFNLCLQILGFILIPSYARFDAVLWCGFSAFLYQVWKTEFDEKL